MIMNCSVIFQKRLKYQTKSNGKLTLNKIQCTERKTEEKLRNNQMHPLNIFNVALIKHFQLKQDKQNWIYFIQFLQ